jgi:hypothetical protein
MEQLNGVETKQTTPVISADKQIIINPADAILSELVDFVVESNEFEHAVEVLLDNTELFKYEDLETKINDIEYEVDDRLQSIEECEQRLDVLEDITVAYEDINRMIQHQIKLFLVNLCEKYLEQDIEKPSI